MAIGPLALPIELGAAAVEAIEAGLAAEAGAAAESGAEAGAAAEATATAGPAEIGPSPVWKLGWAERGIRISRAFGQTLADNFPGIDSFANGVATSNQIHRPLCQNLSECRPADCKARKKT